MKAYIGIDPGKTGAIAVLYDDGHHEIYKMPDTPGEIINIFRDVINPKHAAIVLEIVTASPQMGVVSAFTFGKMKGWLDVCFLQSNARSRTTIRAREWQTALNCLTGGNKNISFQRCKEFFPDSKKFNKQTADALLLAYYGYRKGL